MVDIPILNVACKATDNWPVVDLCFMIHHIYKTM